MLEPICKTDDYFGKCLKGLRSTISNQYEDDVRFNDYKIIQLFKIHHPQLKNRFDTKKLMFDQYFGENTKVYQLYHGTQYAHQIAKEGFDVSLCHSKNRFGSGFYFAPESSKANTYAFGVNKGCPNHNDRACTRCTRQMLICKIALGNAFIAEKMGATPPGYNSVVACPENVSNLRFSEIAVFHPDQILPIALIEYTITNEMPSRGIVSESAMESVDDSDTLTTVLTVGVAVVGTVVLLGRILDAFAESRNQAERRRQNDGEGRGSGSASAGRSNNTGDECIIS